MGRLIIAFPEFPIVRECVPNNRKLIKPNSFLNMFLVSIVTYCLKFWLILKQFMLWFYNIVVVCFILFSWLLEEHRASTAILQFLLSMAEVLASSQLMCMLLRSSCKLLFQARLGLPLFLLLCGFQSKAGRVVFPRSLRCVVEQSLSLIWTSGHTLFFFFLFGLAYRFAFLDRWFYSIIYWINPPILKTKKI